MSKLLQCVAIGLAMLGEGPLASAQINITSASANYGTYSGQQDSPGKLNCGLSSSAPLTLNHTGTFASGPFNVSVSVDANYGGIGSGLVFKNTTNNASVNVIENRSGAGAAWQTSYYLYDQPGDIFIVFNQAAGNSASQQWGYSNSVTNLTEANWVPLVSDHYTTNFSNPAKSVTYATTPCNNTGYYFDMGRGAFNVTPIETPSGLVAHITNSLDLRSNGSQFWTYEQAEQAFYLRGCLETPSGRLSMG